MPTVPVAPTTLPLCVSGCVAVEWAITASAERATVIRKLAGAIHRTHTNGTVASWQNCSHHMCRLAHDCLEGSHGVQGQEEAVGREG